MDSRKEIRSVIKRVLLETTERVDIENKLKNYKGDVELLKIFSKKIENNLSLSDEEIELVKKQFNTPPKETITMDKKISKYIHSNKDLQSEVKNLGIQTYKNLIKTNKKILLNSILENTKFRIDSPNDEWYQRNIDDLTTLGDRFKSSQLVRWGDGSRSTFNEKIKEMIGRCEKKDFFGILEKDGDNDVWSITNKIDTNYSNWAEMIEEKQDQGLISGKSYQELVSEYFKQRPINEVISDSELKEKIEKILKRKEVSIKSLSFAEADIIEAFKDEVSPKLKSIFNRLSRTTREGDYVEENFRRLISNRSGVTNDLYNFSSWGNIVDMVFGIDLLVNIGGTDYAVQVKKNPNHATTAFVRNLDIEYLVIYPLDEGKYNFGYLSKKSDGENFTKKFKQLVDSVKK